MAKATKSEKTTTALRSTGGTEDEYEIEKVIDYRIYRGKEQYKVHWKGYSDDDDQWLPASDLSAADLIRNFFNTKAGKQAKRAAQAKASATGATKKKPVAQSRKSAAKSASVPAAVEAENDSAEHKTTPAMRRQRTRLTNVLKFAGDSVSHETLTNTLLKILKTSDEAVKIASTAIKGEVHVVKCVRCKGRYDAGNPAGCRQPHNVRSVEWTGFSNANPANPHEHVGTLKCCGATVFGDGKNKVNVTGWCFDGEHYSSSEAALPLEDTTVKPLPENTHQTGEQLINDSVDAY
ncbi:hypothetical protein BC832DRAFT_589026 [Gaertneriomyces semiglobifer]|nr:hypothetical protein BC832DRAFT_589026 [Gaertneriomyces semiglobifer]